ncbi:hypothetical protein KO525_07795 [Psychrosphaera sp. B3R10]|uniref:Uncharacterized protein n=1 Tax=Psychrosphaera algicola TaxID=3023714 RepID=A0ABT5FDH3_9GAMM|nr:MULTISPECIES: PilN domain-containing protein [unclassified Psychrosphaera]MBU2882709.1 hypothetical protein [Psychrosphaera sp. I2R16]MBU2989272.1 hypothetical protein [Psychrosphaera sp. B3R10]MDC2889593.1 hypothetical protein [Psychrosphaera sp. G1-22]
MKITINLYQDSLRPQKNYFTLTNVLIASAASLLIMLSWAGSIYLKNLDVITAADKVNMELGYVEQELANYQQALIKHNDSATFTSQKIKFEREYQVKNILLSKIMHKQSGKGVNFYHVMKDLTEHHDHEIWLTDFMFNENDVVFNGFTTHSNAVTRWLTFLQTTESFKDREFSHLRIAAVDEQVLGFEAATSAGLITPEEGRE